VAGESQIVVGHRKELSYLLCQAAEIEQMAMCQYLYAAFSLRTEVGPGLTVAQLEAVDRWRRVILKIAAEEMLHWALVNNLLTAIGSAPYVSRPNLPHRAKGYPPEVQFALLGFGEPALRHFIYFERPQDVDMDDVAEFTPAGERPAPMDASEMQPRPQDYVSQGELYRALDDGLEYLAATLGPDALFIGPPWAQAGPASFGWPELIAVTDLASAKTALVRIIEQGEGGSSRDMATAHYGRFVAILEEYVAIRAADPTFEPAHPVSAAIVRTVEGDELTGPLITDPITAPLSDLFNVINDLLLQMLCRYLAFGHETAEQAGALTDAAVGLMFGAIRPLGSLLATMPVGPAHPGLTAGANFQLAYRSNFLLPHRRVAWLRFVERLEQSATFAEEIEGDAPTRAALARVAGFLRKSAGALAVHIEPIAAQEARVTERMREDEGGADASSSARIRVDPRGPYRVRGNVGLRRLRSVRSDPTEASTWQETERLPSDDFMLLCRCGGSANKPFCDGTHATRDWDPTEAAPTSTYDERAVVVEGSVVKVRDDRSLCVHSGFCSTKLVNVWDMARDLTPDDAATRADVIAMIERCPSGALTYRLDAGADAGADADDREPDLGMGIGVIENGPLVVTGCIPIERGDGQPFEPRNRVVLCRCGGSSMKPLCDGTHETNDFRDPV
jgi:CDGSH-type Zn-finger protein